MKPRPTRKSIHDENRIVITGAGAVCPIGNSVREIWDALVCKKSGKAPITGFDASGFGSAIAAQVTDLPELKTDIHPQIAKSMGKHLSLLLASAEEAYRHAGLRAGEVEAEEIGFFAGMGMVDYRVEDLLPAVLKSLSTEKDLDYEKFFAGGYREIYPLWSLAMLNNVAFCQVAIHLGLRGENCVFAPHADAGIQAVAEAVEVLRAGKATAALAGGVGEEISALSLARAKLNGLICSSNAGETAFLGEGGAMLVLEPLKSAEKRAAMPLAAVAGFGFANEISKSENAPTSHAVGSSITRALAAAGLEVGDIDLVIVGSSGNPEISVCEEAVGSIFGETGHGPAIMFPGRIFGETFAAGPILNAIIGAKIFESSLMPCGLAVPGADGPNRILLIATSYEGRCASLIIEKI